MSLSARETRSLGRIESALSGADPRLTGLFATFSRLAESEQMPRYERLRPRRSRLLAALVLPLILVSGVIAALTGGRTQTPAGCAAMPAVFGWHWQYRVGHPPCARKPANHTASLNPTGSNAPGATQLASP